MSSTEPATPSWDELTLPLRLPDLLVTPTAAQVFMFSAVTWNRHHIHYSAEAARAEGHPDIVVQRGLLGNFLARLLTSWLSKRGRIHTLHWKVLRSAVPGAPLRCEGEVVERADRGALRLLRCALRIVDVNANPIAEGAAEVELLT
jgi:acyl dehydratase